MKVGDLVWHRDDLKDDLMFKLQDTVLKSESKPKRMLDDSEFLY